MKRMLLRALALGLLLGASAGSGTASAQFAISLSPAGTPQFPERTYRLTVPERRGLLPTNVQVTENGEPVSKLALASAEGARGGDFGSILVIDASSSMRGDAIRGAISAARSLAQQRTGAQKLGIILFNRTPNVLLAPTDDQVAIEQALADTPRLAPKTRIFDAVGGALDLLAAARIKAGSIVVLSDGRDTDSRTPGDVIARRARRANVTILTVGLRSRSFDSGQLKELAAAGRGRYTPAESVSDLRRIFRELGAQLASDYLLSYRSFAQPGREVTVAVRVRGVPGIATSKYTVPGGATFVQIEKSFWTSTLGVMLIGLLSALLLALTLWILLARRGRGATLRERVRGFVSTPSEDYVAGDVVLTGRAPGGAERSLERMKWWRGFKEDLEIARITADPFRLVMGTVVATLVVMYLLIVMTGLALVGLFALALPWAVRTWVRIKLERQRTLFVDQLPDILQGAASAIRAGHGLVAALSIVAEDAAEPSRSEILRVVADEGLGVPLDEALRTVQARMESREVMQIALVAQIQREAGGNMAEVLDRVTETLRQRAELRRMVKALTAQGRLSRWVVTALPLVLLLVISVANSAYVEPLFTTGLGVFMLAAAGVMMLLGSMVIGKIVNFKV